MKYNEMAVRSNTAGNTHQVGSEEFRNQRAQDFANQKIKSASDFNFDQYNDNNKGHRGTHISLAEINHLRKNNRNEDGGGKFQENYDVLKQQEDAGAVFGVKAEAAWNKMKERKSRMDNRQDAKERSNSFTSTQQQTTNQDNDIDSTVTGDNNYVYNNQDNSIRQYGGDNRSFVYNAGENPALDTPASMATLGGFYDVDDSPAKQAKFNDLYSTINSDSQKKYSNTSHIAAGAMKRAEQNATINTNALDKRIHDRANYSRAKSDTIGMNLFGDMYKGSAPDWTSPERQTEVEKPDFDKMYDKYTDF